MNKKHKKNISNYSSYIVAGVLIVCFCIVLGIALNFSADISLLGAVSEDNKQVERIVNPTTEEDPFITHVPEEYFDANKKPGKVFVSTIDPWTGNLAAQINVIAFLSFEDAASEQAYQRLMEINQKYPDEVVIFWKDYYLSEQAKATAQAAHCAAEQDKFWEYVGAEMQGNTAADVNSSLLQTCVDLGETETIVNSNYFYGRSLEITQAPAIFINDVLFEQELTYDNLVKYIEDEISQTQE